MTDWQHRLETEAELREHYREPSVAVQNKSIDYLDENCVDFIERSTFVLVGTSDGT